MTRAPFRPTPGRAELVALLGPGGRLAQALPGYEPRPQQLAMAEAVALALAEARPLLVEAGTGTGKTLAYLVPAILSGRKVVVSTGTRNLQEQIHNKDVPLLRDRLGLGFEAAVLKGISNYLCLRRLSEVGDTDDPDLARIADWARTTVSGDRAELPGVPDEAPAWKVATTTPDARLGPKCPFYERCFVTQARRAAAKAQILIVNHHLFFADLALRTTYPGAAVLPDYDAVIFDEAHQVEEVATEHFGITVSTLRVLALLRDARKALTNPYDGSGGREARLATTLCMNLEARADELFLLLRDRIAREAPPTASGDTRAAAPPDLFTDPTRQAAWFRVDAALEELSAHAERRAARAGHHGGSDGDVGGGGGGDRDDEQEAAAAVHRRAEQLRKDLGIVADGPARKHVYWAELRGRTVLLHASPVDVAPLLRERVVDAVGGVVFTSATLTAGGRFTYVRERLGLDQDGATEELAVDSPFDYATQALLYLPRDLPPPQAPQFAAAALARIVELVDITAGRAFVLFTSHRALRHAAAELRRRKLPYPLLVQGESARPTLLDSFRKDVGSVLLATGSFWEGVDVPGDALSLVILEKLPFAAPDDPLTAARVARLEELGIDPFQSYQVPRAALTLKQGFGRLIRRRDDRGIVAILDHRIVARQYGQVFLDSLPPARRTSALEQVRRWW